jgi:hypothetical protein
MTHGLNDLSVNDQQQGNSDMSRSVSYYSFTVAHSIPDSSVGVSGAYFIPTLCRVHLKGAAVTNPGMADMMMFPQVSLVQV